MTRKSMKSEAAAGLQDGSSAFFKTPFQGRRFLNSKDLFEDKREVFIVHNDSWYRLQITKAGKLILNK